MDTTIYHCLIYYWYSIGYGIYTPLRSRVCTATLTWHGSVVCFVMHNGHNMILPDHVYVYFS